MQTMLDLQLRLNNTNAMSEAFDLYGENMKTELAEGLLESGAFGRFASSSNARTVANETFNLLQLCLLSGNLTAFSDMMAWEIKAVLHNHNFHKYQNDMLFLQVLRQTLLHKLSPMLQGDVEILINQLTEIFNYHWSKVS